MAETIISMRWGVRLSILSAMAPVFFYVCWYFSAQDTKISTVIEQQREQNIRLGQLELGRSSADTRIGVLEKSIDFIRDSLGRIEQKLDRNQGQDRRP